MASGDAQVGDKIQIRSGHSKAGSRGAITRISSDFCTLRLEDGTQARVRLRQLRNFSSAARKAWEAMPSRQVGRPKGSKRSDRVSVTLRFDKTLWNSFLRLEKNGVISDRTSLFNQALSQIVESRSKTDHA